MDRSLAVMSDPNRDAEPALTQQNIDCLSVMRAEYGEMPGLALTEPQAKRLWQIAAPTAHMLLEQLVACGFLRCTPTGRYVRADLN